MSLVVPAVYGGGGGGGGGGLKVKEDLYKINTVKGSEESLAMPK